jgi:hypothetical protein
MEYPYTNQQTTQTPQFHSAYVGDLSYPESCNIIPYLPIHQPSFHPTSSSIVSNNLLDSFTWQAQDAALTLSTLAEVAPVGPLLQEQPAVQMQSAVTERRAGEQLSDKAAASLEDRFCMIEDRISRFEDRCGRFEDRIGCLEDKVGGFEELMQNLRNE